MTTARKSKAWERGYTSSITEKKQETKCEESLLLFPVPATPRYNQYQTIFFNFVLLKKNWPGTEANIFSVLGLFFVIRVCPLSCAVKRGCGFWCVGGIKILLLIFLYVTGPRKTTLMEQTNNVQYATK